MGDDDDRKRRGRGEGSITQIRKRGVDGAREDKWMGRVTIAPGKRRTVYGRTREACLKEMRQALSKAEKGEGQPDKRITVATFLREWLDGPVRRSKRASTVRGYRKYVERHLIPHIGRHRLANLTARHVDKMLDDMADAGLSPQTRIHARSVLWGALSWAVEQEKVPRNAAALSTKPRLDVSERSVPSEDDAASITSAAVDDPWGALYVLALDTGLRQGELLGLRWTDIDLDQRSLRVVQTREAVNGPATFGEPKTKRSRRAIGFSSTSAKLLKEHRKRQNAQRLAAGKDWHNFDLVFCRDHGQPLIGSNVSRRWKRFLEDNGLPHYRFHDLRHAYATYLLTSGMPARVVADRLGHSNTRVTEDTYAHLDALQDGAAQHMERLFTGS